MRKYDKKKKEWVSEDELIRRNKAREKCKSGAEHDYVEVLPYGASANSDYKGDTTPYYEAEKAIKEFVAKTYENLLKHGIEVRRYWIFPRDYHTFVCSVCKKNKIKKST